MYSSANNGSCESRGKGKTERISLKQKLLPSILLSLAIPLTVCVFGPFDIYYGNMEEFRYSLTDFLPLCALGALIVAAVIFAVLVLLRGRAYRIVSGVVFAVSVLLFAQRSFMNMGVDALVGDGVGTHGADLLPLIFNTLIWAALIGGAVVAVVLLSKKHTEIIETVTVIAMITLIGMQGVSMLVFSLTSNVWTRVDERKQMSNAEAGKTDVLTFDGFEELSAENNVVVFIVDRFDAAYYDKMLESDPEFFSALDGFTYYNDYTSLYCRTYPAVASILTGIDNDFSTSRTEYFDRVYSDGGHLRTLKEHGYDINLYTKEYYAYENASVMAEYVDNVTSVSGYYVKEPFLLSFDMIRLSFSSYLPFIAKGAMGYMSTPDFNAHTVYELEGKDGKKDIIPYDSDLKTVYGQVESSEFSAEEPRGKFTFIHLDGCHTPIAYDENWEADIIYDSDVAIKLNFAIIYKYIEEMKRLGVYEDATIVITGDHPYAVDDYSLIGEGEDETDDGGENEESTEAESETQNGGDADRELNGDGDNGNEKDRGVRVTAMFFKKSGDAGQELRTSTSQISQDELWNTIFESEGLLDAKDGLSFFDIPEGEDRERRYLLQVTANALVNQLDEDQIVEYKITGTALDPENWEIVKRTNVGDLYK